MTWRLAAAAFSLAALILPAHASGETASELVAKNLAARGGAEKLAAIKSIAFKGELRFPGDFRVQYSETRERIDPKTGLCAVRLEATLQGLTLTQGFNGKVGWRINPFQGRKDAEAMGADEARALADEASIDGALLSAQANGSTVDYLGREDIDGTDTYELRVSQRDGDVFTYYLDPDTFLEIKVLERRTIRGSEQETEYELGDYDRVGGVYFPFSIASGPKNSRDKQVITVDLGEANIDVALGLFDMPAASGSPPQAQPTKPSANSKGH